MNYIKPDHVDFEEAYATGQLIAVEQKKANLQEFKRRDERLGYNGSRSQQIMMDNFISPNPFG